jgi:hypothetical protein
MTVPSPNILLALFIISFSLSAIFHRSSNLHSSPSHPAPPGVFSYYAADIVVPSTNDTFASRPAAFGAGFDDIIEGELVKAWGDGLACDNLTELSGERFTGKIVLVQRGKCSFADKVRQVQYVGGIAAIVGDNTAGSGLLTMYAKGISHPPQELLRRVFVQLVDLGDISDITIPSTFILHASYLSLSFLLSLPPPLKITILPSTASDWPILDTLLLVVLSPLFTLACIYFILILRRRVQRRKELAPLSVVKSLPHRKWKREKDDQESVHEQGSSRIREGYGSSTPPRRVHVLECVICLEDFVDGDVIITLPCNHEFHEVCMSGLLVGQSLMVVLHG